MKPKVNFFTIALIGALISLPVSVFAAAVPDGGQIALAAKRLANDFRPFVISLDRDVKVYHYFKSDRFNQDLPLQSGLFDHQLLRSLNWYWIETGELYSHDGLYAAHDPTDSRDFGNNLLEITIKKGSHVLLGHRGDVRISTETIAAIKAVRNSNYYPGAVGRFDSVLESIPRAVLALALASLDVEAATYEWAGGSSDAVCSYVTGATFVILGTPVNLDLAAKGTGVIVRNISVIGLTSNAVNFDDPSKREAYSRIERFLQLGHGQPLNTAVRSLGIGTMSESERATWRDQIFTCETLHPRDDLR